MECVTASRGLYKLKDPVTFLNTLLFVCFFFCFFFLSSRSQINLQTATIPAVSTDLSIVCVRSHG